MGLRRWGERQGRNGFQNNTVFNLCIESDSVFFRSLAPRAHKRDNGSKLSKAADSGFWTGLLSISYIEINKSINTYIDLDRFGIVVVV